jgi:acyl-[acyl-carrier-protein] desaturase
MLKRVAADENLHFLFYRDLTAAALATDPSGTVQAMERQVKGFQMPGNEMDGFSAHAAAIANAGIYDFRVHYEQVVEPVVLGQWRLDALEGLDDAGERSRDRLLKWVSRLKRVADRMASQSQK